MLVNELDARGYGVRGLYRDQPPKGLPEAVETVTGDLLDAETVRMATADAEIIFHLAAKLHVNNPGRAAESEFELQNVEVTKALLEASDCRRFIFASTINVYGPGNGERVFDEDSPADPKGPYERSKLKAEELVLLHRGGTTLRFAAVYGRRVKGNYKRLVAAIGSRRFAIVGGGRNRRTLVHESDAVRAAIMCAEDERACGKLYNVTDGEVHTLRDIVAAICKAQGRSEPAIRIPEGIARAASAGADLFLRAAGSDARITPLVAKMTGDLAVSGDRIRREIGFKPVFGLEEGWATSLAG